MSKSIAVLGSHTSGHNGYPSTVVVEGTTKLTINGKPAALGLARPPGISGTELQKITSSSNLS